MRADLSAARERLVEVARLWREGRLALAIDVAEGRRVVDPTGEYADPRARITEADAALLLDRAGEMIRDGRGPAATVPRVRDGTRTRPTLSPEFLAAAEIEAATPITAGGRAILDDQSLGNLSDPALHPAYATVYHRSWQTPGDPLTSHPLAPTPAERCRRCHWPIGPGWFCTPAVCSDATPGKAVVVEGNG